MLINYNYKFIIRDSSSLYRWSNIQPVPSLGQPEDSIEHIEEFYNFW